MNPGVSAATTGVLSSRRASDASASVTDGSVDGAGMISTSAMSGTGLKKCIPATRSGCAVAAAISATDSELVFVASDAQLLRFDASSVRPQGRSAGGMAGMRLADDAQVIAFDVVGPSEFDAVVVTVAGSTTAIPGTDAGSAKVSLFSEFPAKGRATGGVRAQRFLKGEDAITLAWVGTEPRAVGPDGSVRTLPASGAKRDASGTALDGVIGAIGTGIR